MSVAIAAAAVLREYIQRDPDRTICLHCLRSATPGCDIPHVEPCVIGDLARQMKDEALVHDREGRN